MAKLWLLTVAVAGLLIFNLGAADKAAPEQWEYKTRSFTVKVAFPSHVWLGGWVLLAASALSGFAGESADRTAAGTDWYDIDVDKIQRAPAVQVATGAQQV